MRFPDLAMNAAQSLGAEYADIRVQKTTDQVIFLRNLGLCPLQCFHRRGRAGHSQAGCGNSRPFRICKQSQKASPGPRAWLYRQI